MRNELPETCFATLPGTGELIILKRGETGYYRSDWDTGDRAENQQIADLHNRKCGINPAQVEAMKVGSMCGFHVPGANPQIFFDSAQHIRSYETGVGSVIQGPFMTNYSSIKGNLHQYQVAGKDSFYVEPAIIPKDVMGTTDGIDFVVLMDMVQGKPLVPVTAKWSSFGAWSMSFEAGSYISGKEMNAGYQIIAKVPVGPVEYALGELGGKHPSFVTWERTPANDGSGPPNYYWGHYFDNRDDAIKDFCGRASEKYEMLSENRKPSIKAQLAAKSVPGDQPIKKTKDLEVR